MDIVLSNADNRPIYVQIVDQIKEAILAGNLQEGETLPSIRALANDLRISVITTKRAFTELEQQGFIETVQGKGSFVAGGNQELLREEKLRRVEQLLTQALTEAKSVGLDASDLHNLLDLMDEE